jgi:hypothetical protein
MASLETDKPAGAMRKNLEHAGCVRPAVEAISTIITEIEELRLQKEKLKTTEF